MYRWQAYDTTKFPAEIKQMAAKRRELRKSVRFTSFNYNNCSADTVI